MQEDAGQACQSWQQLLEDWDYSLAAGEVLLVINSRPTEYREQQLTGRRQFEDIDVRLSPKGLAVETALIGGNCHMFRNW